MKSLPNKLCLGLEGFLLELVYPRICLLEEKERCPILDPWHHETYRKRGPLNPGQPSSTSLCILGRCRNRRWIAVVSTKLSGNRTQSILLALIEPRTPLILLDDVIYFYRRLRSRKLPDPFYAERYFLLGAE